MFLKTFASLLVTISLLGCSSGETPLPYTIITKEENTFKNDIYYRIALTVPNNKKPTLPEVEATYRDIFDDSKRKFVVFMYLPSTNTSSSAYDRCSKLPNGAKDCDILSGGYARCSKLPNGDNGCVILGE